MTNDKMRAAFWTALLCLILALGLCACGQEQAAPETAEPEKTAASPGPEWTEAPDDGADEPEGEAPKPDDSEDHESDVNEEEPGWRVYYDEAAMEQAGWRRQEHGENEILSLSNADGAVLTVSVRWIGSITAEEYFQAQRAAFLEQHSQAAMDETWETPWGYEGQVYRSGGVTERCSYLEGFGIEILIDLKQPDDARMAEVEALFFGAQFDIYAAG